MKWRCVLVGGPECGGEIDSDTEPTPGKRYLVQTARSGVVRYRATGEGQRGKAVLMWDNDNGKEKVTA